jgi:protein-S-isoprenylcysteine O-methyltransferase
LGLLAFIIVFWPPDQRTRFFLPLLFFAVALALWNILERHIADSLASPKGTSWASTNCWPEEAHTGASWTSAAFLGPIFLVVLMAPFVFSIFFPPQFTLFPVGTAGLVLCILLRLWSLKTLGGYFISEAALLKKHRLIQGGPYRWLRHPSEWANLGILLSTALILGQWPALLFPLSVYLPLSLRRMKEEDDLLSDRFGVDFDSYAKERW